MTEKKPIPTAKVFVEAFEQENSNADGELCLRNIHIDADGTGSLGLHLSRTPWDPYPWVSGVLPGSRADQAGARVGDCVLEANGENLLGLKIVDIAALVKNGKPSSQSLKPGISLLLWNSGYDKNNLNPQSLSRFASCLQNITGLLECPVCLEIIRPPSWQCCHGHLICSRCRAKTTKCPICRVMMGRGRCIVADKLFSFLVQTLGHREGGKHPATTKSSNFQHINAHEPLLTRDHRQCKQPLKLKTNNSSIGTAETAGHRNAEMTSTSTSVPAVPAAPFQYCCPSGQPCDKMKNQHDILIHLQKSHQTSVVQYYATPGETLSINFNESCITCVVLVPVDESGRTVVENNNPRHGAAACCNCTNSHKVITTVAASTVTTRDNIFFLARFRCMEASGQVLYWLWYLGEPDELERFGVSFSDDRDGGTRWTGRPVSLQQNCKDVLKSKQFVRMDLATKEMKVTVKLN
ncbi:uncharacterized protein LOC131435753 [Malaya genurostris]|uniref:uncharacterized protein LOC131435753 n=1 Tax=Malaya genurostris TaxID=325434 RepID=UPI0026F3851D|nr:uncharacterized protein LOC131435753 [Malaya genurostris]XP_058459927.1 uncharacterized protein LOC131435753 [Malaya genurostris]XP_058459935.1 uncharacterized protein LOC131435753 [Malaya genurostris]